MQIAGASNERHILYYLIGPRGLHTKQLRSGIFEAHAGKTELTVANAMNRLAAENRHFGIPEAIEAGRCIDSGHDAAMILIGHVVQVLR
ncbi:MAG TPA: hypothetical protein VJU59_11470 [Paraburkholderia sp.]|uniref:hypothetical protein n=1 Tax=Paraburkholderia sp. TaxID=1926495 RepID=UPI002B45EB43|nr:hypothetical protein [Paraburkholderia sp.]HKR40278.1 hypothetical protein [Paraburkholderia sp.]